MALLDAATGLRVSELLALRWSDVDFENLELRVTRSQAVTSNKRAAQSKVERLIVPHLGTNESGKVLKMREKAAIVPGFACHFGPP